MSKGPDLPLVQSEADGRLLATPLIGILLGLFVAVLMGGCRDDGPRGGKSARPAAKPRPTARSRPAAVLRERCPPPPPLGRPAWPAGFKRLGTVMVPEAELPTYASRLGGKLVSLSQHRLAPPQGKEVRVNVVEAANAAEARAIVTHLGRKPGLAGRLLRASRFVVEIVGADLLTQQRIAEALDLLDRTTRRYRVKLRMALVDSGDAGAINRAFNLLLAARPDDVAWRQALATELGQVRLGSSLALRRVATAAGVPRYSFSPAPASTSESGVATRYTFARAPRLHGIPYVDVRAEVPTAGYRAIAGPTPDPRLTSPTSAWPTQDPSIRSIVNRLVKPGATPPDRLVALHGWVNSSIPQGGAQLGARGGTLATLKKGHGRCWERSDVLVTLLRAAGIHTRQIAGWVEGLGGHIWAEAYLPGVGWIGVDATAPWIGVAGEYIPLLITEDGDLSVFYLSAPRLEHEGCKEDG